MNAVQFNVGGVNYDVKDGAVANALVNFGQITPSFQVSGISFNKSGYYIDPATGVYAPNSNYTATDLFCVFGLTGLQQSGITACYYAFYDRNSSFISGSSGPGGIAVPVNAWYMKTSCPTSQVSNFSITNCSNRDMYTQNRIDGVYANVGLWSAVNLFKPNVAVMGKYVIYTTGELATNEEFFASDYIEVSRGAVISVAPMNQYALYDYNKNYITGDLGTSGSSLAPQTIMIPADSSACYIRFCARSSTLNSAFLKITGTKAFDKNILHITTSVGLLNGIEQAYASGITEVIVEAGTYDLINEYKAKYGSSYFDNYATDYNGLENGNNDRGLWLENIKVTFAQNAFVTCNYTGNNENVKTYFSAFAPGGNVEIIGLNLRSSNLRYGLHPDYNPSTYSKFIMRNCDLKETKNGDPRSIGAGLGYSCDWLFENCIFRTPTGETGAAVVSIHNNETSGSKSIVTFRNCYVDGDGKLSLRWFGSSTEITNVFICGCSYETAPELKSEVGSTTDPENVALILIGNELRTN